MNDSCWTGAIIGFRTDCLIAGMHDYQQPRPTSTKAANPACNNLYSNSQECHLSPIVFNAAMHSKLSPLPHCPACEATSLLNKCFLKFEHIIGDFMQVFLQHNACIAFHTWMDGLSIIWMLLSITSASVCGNPARKAAISIITTDSACAFCWLGWKFWIPASALNFYWIPVRQQVLYMSTCSLLWTAYLSYACNKDVARSK